MNLTPESLSEILLKYDPASTGSPIFDEYEDEANAFFDQIEDVENSTDVFQLLQVIFDTYFGEDSYELKDEMIEEISELIFNN